MPKVTRPLMSGEAWGNFSNLFSFRRGGVVTRIYSPAQPGTPAQEAQKANFRRLFVALTEQSANSLYVRLDNPHDVVIPKLTTQSVEASADLVDDSDMGGQVEAGALYLVQLTLFAQGTSSTHDMKCALALPAGCSGHWGRDVLFGVPDSQSPSGLSLISQEIYIGTWTPVFGVKITGYVQVGETAGDMVFRWAMKNAYTGTLTVFAGSVMRVTKLN